MEQLKKILGYVKKILASTKTTIVLSIIIIVLLPFCWERIVYDFECLAVYLYGTGIDNKGKLLTVILTTIGGLGALWGLWLNNQRLKQQIRQVNEQTRQNDIAIQNSNDKRFGEAIGYLNDDNEGIAIGGVYALYQLAKEDERYAPIITNIFYNYVIDNPENQDKKSYKTILSLLFSKDNPFIFDSEIRLQGITLNKEILYLKNNRIKLLNCDIKSVTFKYCKTIDIESSKVDNASFENCITISISDCEVTNDTSIIGEDINQIILLNSYIFYFSILAHNIKSLFLKSCQLHQYISIKATETGSLNIENVGKLKSTSLIIANLEKPIEFLSVDDETILRVNLPMN